LTGNRRIRWSHQVVAINNNNHMNNNNNNNNSTGFFPHQQSTTSSCNYSYFSTTASNDDDGDEQEQQQQQPRQKFDELDIHRNSLKALHRHGLYNLTEIQEKAFDVIVSGKDVVGRARTGTGKTLAFVLPALERIVRSFDNNDNDNDTTGIQMLILSPTRELALQIGQETERLVAQHHASITSQVIYGGSSKRYDIEQFNTIGLPTILVATPGRLKDHLASTRLKRDKLFIDAVQNLQTLVLDETDRLLDMGFRRDIQDILACLPGRQKRQTLLFSATLPKSVEAMIETTVKPNYEVIDCIQEEDPATHTNVQTEQSHIVLPSERFWSGSMDALLNLMNTKSTSGGTKIMVFFPMTSLVQLYADVFNLRFGRRVLELHGKMHQRSRTTISRQFRNSKNAVLFTSDVSARGVDYPNVTHVVQIGAADSRETYIHRLGRTGRAGKRGKGLLILPELEKTFLRDLDGLDLTQDEELDKTLAQGLSKGLDDKLGPLVQEVRAGRDPDIETRVNDAYQAMIAFYFQRYKNEDKPEEIVSTINSLVEILGLRELPAIEKRRAEKIGVDALPGINITQRWSDQKWSGSWGTTPPPKKPFGMPYGDFEGKFPDRGRRDAPRGGGGGSRDERHSDGGGSNYQSPPRRRDDRNSDGEGSRHRSPPRRRDDRNSDWEGSQHRSPPRRRDDRNSDGEGSRHRSPPRRRDDRNRDGEGSRHRSPPRRGSSMDRPQRGRRETSHGDRPPPRDQFAKAGWSTVTDFKAMKPDDENRKGGLPPRKRSTFQRWESPGEFNFKK
jgi:ATP-dependent RNA helicase MSS116